MPGVRGEAGMPGIMAGVFGAGPKFVGGRGAGWANAKAGTVTSVSKALQLWM